MKALVTGSAGFIGSQLVTALAAAGHEVMGLDVAYGGDARTAAGQPGIHAASGRDARDYFRHGETRYDLVVHCAAVVGGRRVVAGAPIEHAANLEIDAALFQWAARTKPGRVVYFSSSCAYPVKGTWARGVLREDDIDLRHPMWPDELYGWTKLTGELLARTARGAGVNVSIVRPFSVYGPGVRDGFAMKGLGEQVRRRADPVEIWGDEFQVRDFIHVSDVAAAVLAMARQGIDGPVNLGTGRGTSLADLVALMGKTAGYEPQVQVNDAMPAGVPSLVADPSRLHEFCVPEVTLEDGIAEILA